MWGTARFMRPSRFLKEIPAQFLENLSASTLQRPASDTESYEEAHEGFAAGDQVLHKEFGVGTVQKAYEGSFGLTYEVHFSDADINRTLVAKYAKLQAYPT
jgi:DNA helicase-2/ATP-dependent DNA helicase PcrA